MLKQWQIDKREVTEEKFWRNIQKLPSIHGECWIWTGKQNNNHNTAECEGYDYGEFVLTDKNWKKIAGVTRMAHRLSVQFTYGKVLPKDLYVFPGTCRNYLCINPEHLWIRNQKNTFRMPVAEFYAAGDEIIEFARAA